MKRVRVAEQLYFIRRCINNRIVTTNVVSSTRYMNLNERQRNKLQYTVMKNYRRKLYQRLSNIEKEKKSSKSAAMSILRSHHRNTLESLITHECNYATTTTRQHFRERYNWLRDKQCRRRALNHANDDNVEFSDAELIETEYESNPQLYGGTTITENEREALKLPPKIRNIKRSKASKN